MLNDRRGKVAKYASLGGRREREEEGEGEGEDGGRVVRAMLRNSC